MMLFPYYYFAYPLPIDITYYQEKTRSFEAQKYRKRTNMFWMIAFFLSCANFTGENTSTIPIRFRLEDLVAGKNVIAVGFYGKKGRDTVLEQRTAEIWKVQNGAPARLKQFSKSYFIAIARQDEEIWAVRKTLKHEKPIFVLHYSNNDARSWDALLEIPADSISSIYIHNNCGWVQGKKTLMRSCNKGKTWNHVHMERKSIGEFDAMFFSQSQILLGGKTIRISTDNGKQWTEINEEADVLTASWVATLQNGIVNIGRIQNQTVSWEHEIHKNYQPVSIFTTDDKIVIIANDKENVGHPAIALVSNDNGKTFSQKVLHGCYDAKYATITNQGVVFMSRRGKITTIQL